MSDRPPRERGFALLIILGVLAITALLFARLLAAGGAEGQMAAGVAAGARAEAMADGATYEAIFRLLSDAWPADSTDRKLFGTNGETHVRIDDLAGRLNPNTVSLPVMQNVLIAIGAPPNQANGIAAAMEDWRTPGDQPLPLGAKAAQYIAAGRDYVPTGQPFHTLDEIGLVLGMTPTLLARLKPHLSLFQEHEPDIRLADQIVVQALGAGDSATLQQASSPLDTQHAVRVVEITATAIGIDRATFTRHATVRIGAVGPSNPGGWRILAWD